MSEKDYLADPVGEYRANIQIGDSLNPDMISPTIKDVYTKSAEKIVDTLQNLKKRVGSRHWVGRSGDTLRDALDEFVDAAKANKTEVVEDHAAKVTAVEESARTAKARLSQCAQLGSPGTKMNPYTTMQDAARALQNHYHSPGEPSYPALEYFGRVPSMPIEDRGEVPSGQDAGAEPTASGASSAGGGTPAPVSSGSAVEAGRGGKAAGDAAGEKSTGEKTESGAKAESAAPEQGAAGSGQGQAPADAGASQGAGQGSGQGAGSPVGQDSRGGGSKSGAGFDPYRDAATEAMSAQDWTPPTTSGGSGLGGASLGGGGVGGLGAVGGGTERHLTPKATATVMGSKPVVNVNGSFGGGPGSGGMGNSMMGGLGGMGQRSGGEEKERKTPEYLLNNDHGYALISDLPVVSPEVIGELDAQEYKKQQQNQQEQHKNTP